MYYVFSCSEDELKTLQVFAALNNLGIVELHTGNVYSFDTRNRSLMSCDTNSYFCRAYRGEIAPDADIVIVEFEEFLERLTL